MNLKEKIVKLKKAGQEISWNECSYYHSEHKDTYGRATPVWVTWVGRVEKLLQEAVKSDSEPFVYFNEANRTSIDGNHIDQFEYAKENYLKALNILNSLLEEGDVFGDLLNSEVPELPKKSNKKDSDTALEKSNKKVFIVHGHDHALKVELEVFLAHIGLKPIVLHREIDDGQTIIEKFEANSDVSYAYVLLTPDEVSYTIDQLNLKDEERKKENRARPNVIFEFGYFVAKLGRKKVCVLHKGDVAIPSDLSGLIYKKIDSNVEEIGFSLIKELKAAGLKPEL
ncbi:MAG: nucleotide-binding protein [Gallionellaceae bacterium]|jgi:predicted nucleotide-binding protein